MCPLWVLEGFLASFMGILRSIYPSSRILQYGSHSESSRSPTKISKKLGNVRWA